MSEKKIMIQGQVMNAISKNGKDYKYLSVKIPINEKDFVEKRLFLEPLEYVALELISR